MKKSTAKIVALTIMTVIALSISLLSYNFLLSSFGAKTYVQETDRTQVLVKQASLDPSFFYNYNSVKRAYEITTPQQFDNLRNVITSGYSFILTNDIYIPGEWTTINGFFGTLDCQNNVIYDIELGQNYYRFDYSKLFGIFGYNGGVIKNMILKRIKFAFPEDAWSQNEVGDIINYMGIIAGQNTGTIMNCSVYGRNASDYDVNIVNDNSYFGGIVGYNDGNHRGINVGTVYNCYNYASIFSTGHIGGIIGRNYCGQVNYCFNNGAIDYKYNVLNHRNIGGVIGEFDNTYEHFHTSGNNAAISYKGTLKWERYPFKGKRPAIGQIVGRTWLYLDYPEEFCNGTVDSSLLLYYYSQDEFATNGAVGRNGV